MAPVVYGAPLPRKRDAQVEAVVLSVFATEDAELRDLNNEMAADCERLIRMGAYNLVEAAAAWRVFYDHAAKRFRQQRGFLPLPSARAQAAYARALNERERFRRRMTGDLPR